VNSRSRITSSNERPAFMACTSGTLFGVLTSPKRDALGVGVILLPGGAINNTAFGRNRVGVSLARRLATRGFHVMRFDYHGIGDSDGESVFRLDEPFVEDVRAVVTWMRSSQIERFVLVGTCFGARTALAAAVDIPGIMGLVLSSMPVLVDPHERRVSEWSFVRYVATNLSLEKLRRLRSVSARRRFATLVVRRARLVTQLLGHKQAVKTRVRSVSPAVVGALGRIVEKHTEVLFLFGAGDPSYQHFKEAERGELGTILSTAVPPVEVRSDLDGALHVFTDLSSQRTFVDVIDEWLGRGDRLATWTGMDSA
jgi:alpha/beta superfamily hydrolase